MRAIHRACFQAAMAALATAAVYAPAAAGESVQTRESVETYIVTSQSQSAAGGSQVREVLSLERTGDDARLRVSSDDGSMFLTPVALTAQGQIASSSQDRSVTCYNMAMDVLARQNAPADPASVYVQFFSSVVQIPLRVQMTREQGPLRTLALTGETAGVLRSGESATAAGVVIGATVTEQNGALRSASFNEVHYLGTPAGIIARSNCRLERAVRPPHSATQT